MNTLEISRALVLAVAPFTAKNDVRYYLNGALLTRGDRNPDGTYDRVRMVATDGHTLAIADLPGKGPDADLIIQCESLEWAAKQKGDVLSLSWGDDGGTITAENGASSPMKIHDGTFPAYDAVVPLLQDGEVQAMPGFNPEFLARPHVALKALQRGGYTSRYPGVSIMPNGLDRSVGFMCSGLYNELRFGGVLMPLRDADMPRSALGQLVR